MRIAAFDLCQACYKAEKRTIERGNAPLLRSQNRQAKQLIRDYSSLLLQVATIDASELGGSGLARWVAQRVDSLIDPIRSFVAGQPQPHIDKVPAPGKRFRAYHKITEHLLGIGASREIIEEVQYMVGDRLREVEGVAVNDTPRSRFDSSEKGEIIPFPPPDKLQ